MVADLKFTPSSWSKYPCYKTVHCVLWKLKYVCLLYAVRSGNLDSWGYDAVLCSVLRTVYCSIFFLSFLIPFPPVSARYTAFYFSFLTPFSDWHDVTTTTTFIFPMPLYVSARWSKKWMKREQKQRIAFVGLRLGQQKYFISEASHVVTGRFNRATETKSI